MTYTYSIYRLVYMGGSKNTDLTIGKAYDGYKTYPFQLDSQFKIENDIGITDYVDFDLFISVRKWRDKQINSLI